MFKRFVFVFFFAINLFFILIGSGYSETYNFSDYNPSGQGDEWIYSGDQYYYCDTISGTEIINGITAVKRHRSAATTGKPGLGNCRNTAGVTGGFVQNSDGTRTSKTSYIGMGMAISTESTETLKEGSSWFPDVLTLGQEYSYIETITSTIYAFNVSESTMEMIHSQTLIAVEDISVPAGNFKDCLKIKRFFQGGGFSQTWFEWYAKNVGLVSSSDSTLYKAYVGGITYNGSISTVNNCTATVSSSLVVHIPIVTYSGYNFWVDLQYNSNDSTLTFANYGAISDISPYSNCTASTLSSDFKLHIPDLLIGSNSYWLDLQYGSSGFVITGAGKN